jgi:alpha-tubulin suppressor-like RCC1 family protein
MLFRIAGAAFFLLLVACGSSSPQTTSTTTTTTGTPIDPAVGAALSASLVQAAQSEPFSGALAAQGAALALRAGVEASPVTLTSSLVASAPGGEDEARARSGAVSSAATAFAFQLTVVNSPQGSSTQVFSGVLVFDGADNATLAAGPSPQSQIPPGVGLILLGGTEQWQATAGQQNAQVATQGTSCLGTALPAYVTACNDATFTNAGFDISAATPSGGGASGPKTAFLPNGSLVGAVLTIDCAKTTLCVTTIPLVQVSVNPATATVPASGTQQFAATVTGTSNPAVSWTVEGSNSGEVSSSGLYTAPATAGSYSVTATSVADVTKSATALVTVTAAAVAWTRVAISGINSVGVKVDGTLWTWGDNMSGELGNGTTFASQTTPVQIGTGYALVSAGPGFDFAITTAGELFAWGLNDGGNLGNGTKFTNSNVPVSIGTGFAMVSAGFAHVMAIKSDGTLWGWGDNQDGELGNGTMTLETSPTQIGSDSNWTLVAAGYFYTLAVKSDGTLWAWGTGGSELGTDGNGSAQTTPAQIGTGFVSVAAGMGESYAIATDHSYWAWGGNEDGTLGTGTGAAVLTPTQFATGYASLAQVEHGSVELAVKTDGTLLGWGAANAGYIGNGQSLGSETPVAIGSGYASVAVGDDSVLAVKTDGTLWAFGQNQSGQLGLGTTTAELSPTEVKP